MHKKGFRCGQDHNWPSDLRHQLWIKVKDAEEITGRLQTDLQQLKQKIGPPMPSDINNPKSISILDQITNEIDIVYGLIQDFINARDYLRDYYESH